MKKASLTTFIVILIIVSLAGCGRSNMEGIILETEENTVLLAEDISSDKYEEIKNKSISTIQKEETIRLIELVYDKSNKFAKGDKVNVWISKGINESSPAQADAKKITLKK